MCPQNWLQLCTSPCIDTLIGHRPPTPFSVIAAILPETWWEPSRSFLDVSSLSTHAVRIGLSFTWTRRKSRNSTRHLVLQYRVHLHLVDDRYDRDTFRRYIHAPPTSGNHSCGPRICCIRKGRSLGLLLSVSRAENAI